MILGDTTAWPGQEDGMQVLFISPNNERLFMPPPPRLDLMAAATRRAGHQTRFLELLAW
jgi:hypothetical protein